ncbi:MAG: polyphosphate kinase 2, partial [Hyphomicrobiales bacterium]
MADNTGNSGSAWPDAGNDKPKNNKKKLKNKVYEARLAELQIELVKLQEWIKEKDLKVVVIFEG